MLTATTRLHSPIVHQDFGGGGGGGEGRGETWIVLKYMYKKLACVEEIVGTYVFP